MQDKILLVFVSTVKGSSKDLPALECAPFTHMNEWYKVITEDATPLFIYKENQIPENKE